MPDPNSRWKIFFIEKAGGEEIPVDLDKGAFENLCREYCPSFTGEFLLKKIRLILSLTSSLE